MREDDHHSKIVVQADKHLLAQKQRHVGDVGARILRQYIIYPSFVSYNSAQEGYGHCHAGGGVPV